MLYRLVKGIIIPHLKSLHVTNWLDSWDFFFSLHFLEENRCVFLQEKLKSPSLEWETDIYKQMSKQCEIHILGADFCFSVNLFKLVFFSWKSIQSIQPLLLKKTALFFTHSPDFCSKVVKAVRFSFSGEIKKYDTFD